jgi:hypothetical protein
MNKILQFLKSLPSKFLMFLEQRMFRAYRVGYEQGHTDGLSEGLADH